MKRTVSDLKRRRAIGRVALASLVAAAAITDRIMAHDLPRVALELSAIVFG
jgi:hypothetical protein